MGEKRRKGLLCFPAQSCASGQLGVNAALRDELGVRAALQNAVFADNDDFIRVADGGQAVGNDQRGATGGGGASGGW